MFEDFVAETVDAEGLPMFVRHTGAGPPVLLLHGHPRTSATWHRVAPDLVARGFTVVCPDLPGYGRSGKPEPAEDHAPHAKRAGARRLLALMRTLGHEKFAVVGHDRGSLFAFRLAMDWPRQVVRAVLVDCLPVSEHLDRITPRFAIDWWHWFFFAQPEKPERVINADPDAWYHGDPATMGEENYAEFRATMRNPEVVRGMIEDYRAGLTVDDRDERADRAVGKQLEQPVLVLWTLRDDLEQLYGNPLLIWQGWAKDVTGHGIDSGHHVAELAPAQLTEAVASFLRQRSG